jgi:Putative addiction module component
MTTLEEIEAKAMQLPSLERGHLAHDLLSTLEDPANDSDAYEKEIQRRITRIESGKAIGIPANKVFSLVENRYA